MRIRQSLLLSLSGICLLAVRAGAQQPASPSTAKNIAERYKQSLSWRSKCFSMQVRIDSTYEGSANSAQRFYYWHQVREITYRRDDIRAEWFQVITTRDVRDESLLAEPSGREHSIYLDGYNIHAIWPLNGPPTRVSVRTFSSTDSEREEIIAVDATAAGPMDGVMGGCDTRSLADLLTDCDSLHIRAGMEDVAGHPCHVLEGRTNYGTIAAWIAPGQGYAALRWTLTKQETDLFDGTPLGERWPDVRSGTMNFQADRVQQVGRFFVVVAGRFDRRTDMHTGSYALDHYRFVRSDVNVDPDFQTLKAFVPKLSNGTRIHKQGTLLEWRDGRIVPMSPEGRALLQIERWLSPLKEQIQDIQAQIEADQAYERMLSGPTSQSAP